MQRYLLLLLTLCFFHNGFSQFGQRAYEAEFSQPFILKGKDKLKATEIVAEDEKRIYLIISESRVNFSEYAGLVKLQSIGKSDLKPIRTIELNQTLESTSSYRLREVLKTASGFLVISEKTNQGVVSGYASHLDFDLNVLGGAQKIYEAERSQEDYRIIQRPKSNHFIVLKQAYQEIGMPIKVTYTVYNENIKVLHSGEAEIGVSFYRTGIFSRKSLASVLPKMEYSENGELVLLSWIKNEGIKQMGSYFMLFINPMTDVVDRKEVFVENDALIGEFTLLEMGNELILTGLYSDDVATVSSFFGQSQPYVNSFNGTFLQRYNSSSHQQTSSFRSPFDQATLNRLPQTNPAKKIGVLFGKRSREKDQDDVSGSYEIIKVVYSPDRMIATFYYEYIYNSSHTTSSYSSTGMSMQTTTTYTSKRGNFFTYQLSLADGSMNWVNTVKKYMSLSSSSSSIWDVETMFVVPRNEGDMVFYNSSRIFNENDASDLTGVTVNTRNLDQDYFMTSIDSKTGMASTQLPKMSPHKLKPYEKLQLSRSFVSTLDRECYTINSQYKYRPELGVLSCATMPFCFAGYFIYALTKKNAYNETYTIAKITF